MSNTHYHATPTPPPPATTTLPARDHAITSMWNRRLKQNVSPTRIHLPRHSLVPERAQAQLTSVLLLSFDDKKIARTTALEQQLTHSKEGGKCFSKFHTHCTHSRAYYITNEKANHRGTRRVFCTAGAPMAKRFVRRRGE